MLGYLKGRIIHSDGKEVILLTASGVGYQFFCSELLQDGRDEEIYISQIIRENSEELFGFKKLSDKKTFELLLKVNGVGPKSAFSLLTSLGSKQLSEAIIFDNKKVLQSAPGIGPKAAAQIILDLKKKVSETFRSDETEISNKVVSKGTLNSTLLSDALHACIELGFKESEIVPVINKIIAVSSVDKSEDLLKLVLKEMG